jgi:alpha-amylase/alpha-mannosidase (GH57 family)
MSMSRFICIHGHFYQPPRENAWLEAIELQDSAYPYHDWNERITAECYAPNAVARMHDHENRIIDIVNNYSRISFNFGPTLLAWLQCASPDVYQALLQADAQSMARFSGHGSALAQVYSHPILPLANARDQQTQVLWGIRDFQARFQRDPEGMWLAETAADIPSLATLARFGIRFTILSPFQAKRVRPVTGGEWQNVDGGRIDPKVPYLLRLPNNRRIVLFFYDAPVSQAVAFERLLTKGERLAHRLVDSFVEDRADDQLVHIATDGESYGHHHRHGEMALAFALHYIESNQLARLTNYGEFLASHPPAFEVEIHQPSAWSCPHGVDRWRTHCGCNTGGRPHWNQQWRAPLRQALDWLRDQLAPHFATRGAALFHDPWTARDEYIDVILDRSTENLARFFQRHARQTLSSEDWVPALRLLELQRHALLMYTSCGWFFDELSGIETVQVIQYAGRALQLARDLLNLDLEEPFLAILARARSNIPEHKDGRHIYRKFVRPAIVDREKVGAHYAVSSLFEDYPESTRVYSFTCEREDRQEFIAGKSRLLVGRARVTFEITRNSDTLSFGVLHFGDHNINCGVRIYQGPEPYQQLVQAMRDAFDRADFPEIIRIMDRNFGESNYSLHNLFRDEQRKVLNQVLASTHEDIESRFRQITDSYTPLMRYLEDLNAPLPAALQAASAFIFNADIRRQLESDTTDAARLHALLEESHRRNVELDWQSIGYAAKHNLERRMAYLIAHPEDIAYLSATAGIAGIARAIPPELNLWKAQNTYHEMQIHVHPDYQRKAKFGDPTAKEWLGFFATLGDHLGFRVNSFSAQPATPDEPGPAS